SLQTIARNTRNGRPHERTESPQSTPPTARHSTQKPQNSQNKTGFLCGFREFCVDRRSWQPVVKVRLHSTGDASPLTALLLPQILPDILGRRALPSGRLAGLGATPGLSPRAVNEQRPSPRREHRQGCPSSLARSLRDTRPHISCRLSV